MNSHFNLKSSNNDPLLPFPLPEPLGLIASMPQLNFEFGDYDEQEYDIQNSNKALHLKDIPVPVPELENDNFRTYFLPFGWIKFAKKRTSGATAGMWDVYLYSPAGKKLRSNRELENYLKKNPDVKCNLGQTNVNRPKDLSSPKYKKNDQTPKAPKRFKKNLLAEIEDAPVYVKGRKTSLNFQNDLQLLKLSGGPVEKRPNFPKKRNVSMDEGAEVAREIYLRTKAEQKAMKTQPKQQPEKNTQVQKETRPRGARKSHTATKNYFALDEPMKINRNPFYCDFSIWPASGNYCGLPFKTEHELIAHKIAHKHPGSRFFQCASCGHKFNEITNLTKHVNGRKCMKNVSRASELVCRHCDHKSSDKDDAIVHMAGHFDKTHCKNCKKMFKLKIALIKHEKKCHFSQKY